MLECSGQNSTGSLTDNGKSDPIFFKPGKQFSPTRVHLELWDQRVDFVPVNRSGVSCFSRDCCSEKGFIEIGNQTFNLSIHKQILVLIYYTRLLRICYTEIIVPKVVTILDSMPFTTREQFRIPVKECVQFHSKALPENQVLSNHYDCIIRYRDCEFYSVEQLFLALTIRRTGIYCVRL